MLIISNLILYAILFYKLFDFSSIFSFNVL